MGRGAGVPVFAVLATGIGRLSVGSHWLFSCQAGADSTTPYTSSTCVLCNTAPNRRVALPPPHAGAWHPNPAALSIYVYDIPESVLRPLGSRHRG